VRKHRGRPEGRVPPPGHPGPENPPLGVEGHKKRTVTCTCGWSGTIEQLQNFVNNDGVLNMGADFPVCPSCHSEKGLKA
jgi:hypothetical protein